MNHWDAEEASKIASGGTTNLLLTTQQTFVDGNVATLQALRTDFFSWRIVPGGDARVVSLDPPLHLVQLAGVYSTSVVTVPPKAERIAATQTKPADAPAPLPADFKPSNRPRSVAAAPTEADWSRAGVWSITIPKSAFTDTPGEQHFLRITYTGNVARISVNGHLLDDNFADGRPWLVGLARFAPQLQQSGGKLDLSIYPLRPNPPIFFEPGYGPKPDAPPASVSSVELLTQYTLKLKLEPTPTKKP